MWQEVMIIYDGYGDKGRLVQKTTEENGKIEVDMKKHDDVTIINITQMAKPLESIDREQNYPKKEVAKFLSMTPRTIQYYTDMNLVTPAENPKGRGVTRKYSYFNMYTLLCIRELTKHGYNLATIKDIINSRLHGVRVIKP